MAEAKSDSKQNEIIDAQIISEDSSSSHSKEANEATSRSASTWALKTAVLLLLIGLAVVGGGGYWYLNQKLIIINDLSATSQQLQQALADVKATQNNNQSRITSDVETIANQVTEYQQAVAQLQQNADLRQQQIDNLYNELNESQQRRPSDWLLAEADYLTRMAGRKLWLEQDFSTSIMLLKDADDRLRQLADPALLNIRALLADDIQTLQQTNPLDRAALALQVSALINKISQLPINQFTPPADTTPTAEVTESIADWQQNLAALWHDLVDDFISVKNIEAPIEPILSAQQQRLIQEQLKYQLMLVQMAIMNAEVTLYQQSLTSAVTIINQHFQADTYSVKGFIQQLERLQTTDISQAKILTLSAQQALTDKLAQRTNKVTTTGADEL